MTWKMIWLGSREDLEPLDTLLSEVLFPPADAVSLLKDDAVVEDLETSWSLHAYFTDLPDRKLISAIMGEYGISLPAPELEELPEKDWVAHALEGLGLVEAGDFVLFGSHDAEKVKDHDKIAIQVEANRAFGTGHHPTTAGCLEALTCLKKHPAAKIADVGTGSGILAMAARHIWPDARIVATDLDDPSINIAKENADLNQIKDIHFEVATGLEGPALNMAPLDLILANILAEPLTSLAPDMDKALARNGRIVLAGLLKRQEQAVLDAYEAQGFMLDHRIDHDTWPVLILRHRD